jgi:hypothetical protein
MRERAFVLIPLAEIAPFTIEPVSGQTIQQLATNVSTQGIDKTSIVLAFRTPLEQGEGHQNSNLPS